MGAARSGTGTQSGIRSTDGYPTLSTPGCRACQDAAIVCLVQLLLCFRADVVAVVVVVWSIVIVISIIVGIGIAILSSYSSKVKGLSVVVLLLYAAFAAAAVVVHRSGGNTTTATTTITTTIRKVPAPQTTSLFDRAALSH